MIKFKSGQGNEAADSTDSTAFVCLSVTLLLVSMMTGIIQAKYEQHAVFDRTIRKMEESLIEKMNDVEGCLKECQIEKDSPS